jgi:hypothetical protein
MLVTFTVATALVIGGIVSLATGSWWFLVVAVGLHLTGTAVVVGVIGKHVQQEDKPDPVTEARLEARRPPHARRTGPDTRGKRRRGAGTLDV